MKQLLSKSKDINPNYAAQITRIDKIEPHPNADNLVYALIGDQKIIVDKSMMVGDIVVYFPLECVICDKYLRSNNLYSDPALNEDHNQKGFFTNKGRVRCIKLRGEYSMGYVAPITTLEKTWPELKTVLWSHIIGATFDTVLGQKIAWKYIIPSEEPGLSQDSQKKYKKSMKRLKRYDRMVEGQFKFHYDTEQLDRNISELKPDHHIYVTVKKDGTSIIIGNLLVKKPMNSLQRFLNKLHLYNPSIYYDNIYSTRRVIQNKYLNQQTSAYFYNKPIYEIANEALKKYIPKGVTMYGELVGYVDGTNDCIQKKHDYGCAPGHWAVMPYRYTETDSQGNCREFSIPEVISLTEIIRSAIPDTEKDLLQNLEVLYSGKAGDLYGLYQEGMDLSEWRQKLLEAMRADKSWCMEEDEPLCVHKVPREGVVVRIDNDPIVRAFKLKTKAHFAKETYALDHGEQNIEDMV